MRVMKRRISGGWRRGGVLALVAALLIAVLGSLIVSGCTRTRSTYLDLGDYKRQIKRASHLNGMPVYYGPGGYPDECPFRYLRTDSLFFSADSTNLAALMAGAVEQGAQLVIIEQWSFVGDPLMTDDPDTLPVFTHFYPSVYTGGDCR